MNEARFLTIIKAPHVTEKSAQAAHGYRQYAFEVASNATKPQIKLAVEKLFRVTVHSVRVCNVKSKATRNGRQKAWKKAYVALTQGNEIDIDKL